jgi:hypothetical protein
MTSLAPMPAAKLLSCPVSDLGSRAGFLHGVQTARLTLDQDRKNDLPVRRRLRTTATREPLATMSSFLADFEIAMFLKKNTQTPRLTRRLSEERALPPFRLNRRPYLRAQLYALPRLRNGIICWPPRFFISRVRAIICALSRFACS